MRNCYGCGCALTSMRLPFGISNYRGSRLLLPPPDRRLLRQPPQPAYGGAAGDGENLTIERYGMLPDFPDVKRVILRSAAHLTRMGAEQDPLLGAIPTFRQHEGNRATLRRVDGTEAVLDYRTPLTAQVEFTIDQVREKGPEVAREAARSMAHDLNQQLANKLIDTIDKATEEVGNVIQAGGKPFSTRTYLDALRKMDLGFDDEGNWEPLQFVAGEQLSKRIDAVLEEAERDCAFIAERDAIVAEKREEWRAREANRRLVD
jgi:hypothetical protein